jgi:hypothetical protein
MPFFILLDREQSSQKGMIKFIFHVKDGSQLNFDENGIRGAGKNFHL